MLSNEMEDGFDFDRLFDRKTVGPNKAALTVDHNGGRLFEQDEPPQMERCLNLNRQNRMIHPNPRPHVGWPGHIVEVHPKSKQLWLYMILGHSLLRLAVTRQLREPSILDPFRRSATAHK